MQEASTEVKKPLTRFGEFELLKAVRASTRLSDAAIGKTDKQNAQVIS